MWFFLYTRAVAETPGEIMHWRARVRPRVLSPETGEALPLTDFVGPILAGGGSGVIRIQGPPGSGKTTALDHLAGVVPPHLSVSFLDEPHRPSDIVEALSRGWVVYTSRDASFPTALATNLKLAPWGEDEWIEYLLASDRRHCSSVMARLARAKPETAMLGGNPELWGLVLDRMMADPSVAGPGLRDQKRSRRLVARRRAPASSKATVSLP